MFICFGEFSVSCLRFAVLKENQCRGGPRDWAAAKQQLRLLSGLMDISEGPQGPATETIFALALVFLLLWQQSRVFFPSTAAAVTKTTSVQSEEKLQQGSRHTRVTGRQGPRKTAKLFHCFIWVCFYLQSTKWFRNMTYSSSSSSSSSTCQSWLFREFSSTKCDRHTQTAQNSN